MYSRLTLSSQTTSATGKIKVSVDVKNNSTRDGAEVVQLYVKDMISSVVVPNMQLRGFAKVFLRAGKTQTVSIELDVAKLGLYDINMKYVVEPGDFTIFVGSSSKDLRANATLTVS